MRNEVLSNRTGCTVTSLVPRPTPTPRRRPIQKVVPVPNFETFNRATAGDNATPRVTVLRSGMLSLNKPAFLALDAPEAVELLYDDTELIIGLRPVDASAETAYIVRHPSRGNSGPFLVTALAFTKHYDIDTTESFRWDASMLDGVLCVRLTEAHDAVTSNRAHSCASDVIPLPSDASASPRDRTA